MTATASRTPARSSRTRCSDLDLDGGLDTCQLLSADTDGVSIANGGVQNLSLHAGRRPTRASSTTCSAARRARRPERRSTVRSWPLNLDGYFLFTLSSPNTIPLSNSLFFLDGSGNGAAQFAIPAGTLSVSLIGATLNHAYGVIGVVVEETSNAIPVTFLP